MINIDKYLTFKISKNDWQARDFQRVLDFIKRSIDNSQIDWEQGDEQWGRILVDNNLIAAIVSLQIPLTIIKLDYQKIGCDCQKVFNAHLITIEAFDANLLCSNQEYIEKVFEKPISSNICYDCFSVNDLWWATVT